MLSSGLILLILLGQSPQSGKESDEESLHETVVVTAAKVEQPLLETISLVSVVSQSELLNSPRLTLDDHLRSIPGFNLFRRSSSLVAHPTTQGVSLRGIGPSGTSRSLVLFGGIPLNDPFGGWIHWNRFPILLLERVEISRGATSQLYGSSALGGTIQLIPRKLRTDTLELQGQLSSPGSYELEALASDVTGDWGYLVSGRVFDTNGFFVVDSDDRGEVDIPAKSKFQSFFGRLEYKDMHIAVNLFQEKRGNGTRLQKNRSAGQLLEIGFVRPSWNLNFYAQSGVLESDFSKISQDRTSEFLTAQQRFPSLGLGSSLTVKPNGHFLMGMDWRHANWNNFNQDLLGFFAQELLTLHPRMDVLLGVRLDFWENESFQKAINPRLGILFRTSEELTLRTSVYRGFRAPTLNELYRPFRVGNIITSANPELDEEHLWGTELGVDFHPSGSVLVRVNGFWNSLRDPVSNVTLSVTDEEILRQRQNLGEVTIQGLEAETTLLLGTHCNLRAAYLYTDSTKNDGLRLPQVARHQGFVGINFKGPVSLTAQAQWVGDQFEDDRNELKLGNYTVFHFSVRRPISDRIELFLAAENILNRRYAVGRTPIQKLGAPRFLHGGIRLRLN